MRSATDDTEKLMETKMPAVIGLLGFFETDKFVFSEEECTWL